MTPEISNLAPKYETILITHGSVCISISREDDGSIEVVVTDNSNVTEEKYVLGRTGKEVKDFLSGEFESEE